MKIRYQMSYRKSITHVRDCLYRHQDNSATELCWPTCRTKHHWIPECAKQSAERDDVTWSERNPIARDDTDRHQRKITPNFLPGGARCARAKLAECEGDFTNSPGAGGR